MSLRKRIKNKQKQPFERGFLIYMAPFYFTNNIGSTRIVCSAYYYKEKESPITNQLYLERYKVVAEHQSDETILKFTVKYRITKVDNKQETEKVFNEDVESPFEAPLVTGFKGMKFKGINKSTIRLYNEKDQELIIRDILNTVFKDLVIDAEENGYTNNIYDLIDALVDTNDEDDILQLIREFSVADLDIYSEYKTPTDEEVADSNQRMYSRAVAIYTAFSVTTPDVPEDGEVIKLNPAGAGEDVELHEIALLAAILHIKGL